MVRVLLPPLLKMTVYSISSTADSTRAAAGADTVAPFSMKSAMQALPAAAAICKNKGVTFQQPQPDVLADRYTAAECSA